MHHSGNIPFTRAVGTVRLAGEFLDAARRQDLARTPPSLAPYFLLGHALELAFKSILITHGTSARTLRNLGHDLVKARTAALKACMLEDIELESSDIARLDLLAPYYKAKALQYLEPGYMRLPIAAELLATAERIVQRVSSIVEARVRANLRTSHTSSSEPST